MPQLLPGCAGAISGTGTSITGEFVADGVDVGAGTGAGVGWVALMVDVGAKVGLVAGEDAREYPAVIPNIAVVASPVAKIFADAAGEGRFVRRAMDDGGA